LRTRFGLVSTPVAATHCQFPTLFATSASTSNLKNVAAPRLQSRPSVFVRKEPTTSRALFGSQPSAASWRMPASTIG
jgi:hypothetical protein